MVWFYIERRRGLKRMYLCWHRKRKKMIHLEREVSLRMMILDLINLDWIEHQLMLIDSTNHYDHIKQIIKYINKIINIYISCMHHYFLFTSKLFLDPFFTCLFDTSNPFSLDLAYIYFFSIYFCFLSWNYNNICFSLYLFSANFYLSF